MQEERSSSETSLLIRFFVLTWFAGIALIYIFNTHFIDFSIISANDFTSRMRFSEFAQTSFSLLSLIFLVPIFRSLPQKHQSFHYSNLLLMGLGLQLTWSLIGSLMFPKTISAPIVSYSIDDFVSEVAFSFFQIILITQVLRQFLQSKFPRRDHQLTLQIFSYILICIGIEVFKIFYFNLPITNSFDFYIRFLPSGLFLSLIVIEYKTNLVQTLFSFLIFYCVSKVIILNFDQISQYPLPNILNHLFYYILSLMIFNDLLFSHSKMKIKTQSGLTN